MARKGRHLVMMKEYVYILTNESMPDMVKIGMTTRSVEERVKELNTTSVPTDFIIHSRFCVKHAQIVEQIAHQSLDAFRINHGREFFNVSPESAEQRILAIIEKQNLSYVEPIIKSGNNESNSSSSYSHFSDIDTREACLLETKVLAAKAKEWQDQYYRDNPELKPKSQEELKAEQEKLQRQRQAVRELELKRNPPKKSLMDRWITRMTG